MLGFRARLNHLEAKANPDGHNAATQTARGLAEVRVRNFVGNTIRVEVQVVENVIGINAEFDRRSFAQSTNI